MIKNVSKTEEVEFLKCTSFSVVVASPLSLLGIRRPKFNSPLGLIAVFLVTMVCD